MPGCGTIPTWRPLQSDTIIVVSAAGATQPHSIYCTDKPLLSPDNYSTPLGLLQIYYSKHPTCLFITSRTNSIPADWSPASTEMRLRFRR